MSLRAIYKPVVSPKEAVARITDGMTIMVGGFNYGGIPYTLVDALLAQGTKSLTMIGIDTAYDDVGHGKLVSAGRIKKAIASHVGLNKTTGKLFESGEMELELYPMGTLVEKVRAGGAGLGGFLTPAGVGTLAAEGKRTIEVDGREYLLELPLRADVALIRGYRADRTGALTYRGTNQNINPTMALAADFVIAEVDEVVSEGALDPDEITTPGMLIDMLVIKGDGPDAART